MEIQQHEMNVQLWKMMAQQTERTDAMEKRIEKLEASSEYLIIGGDKE